MLSAEHRWQGRWRCDRDSGIEPTGIFIMCRDYVNYVEGYLCEFESLGGSRKEVGEPVSTVRDDVRA